MKPIPTNTQDGRDDPTGDGRDLHVPVADGRDRDDRPPDALPKRGEVTGVDLGLNGARGHGEEDRCERREPKRARRSQPSLIL
jgi:hypothetical protein